MESFHYQLQDTLTNLFLNFPQMPPSEYDLLWGEYLWIDSYQPELRITLWKGTHPKIDHAWLRRTFFDAGILATSSELTDQKHNRAKRFVKYYNHWELFPIK